jgi:hypothetical protein
VSVAGEIVITGRDFYDFDAKYLGAPGIDLVCPAELARRARRDAAHRRPAFEAVGGEGLSGRLLLHGHRVLRQRGEHDAGLHADLDVPDVLDRVGSQLPRPHHSSSSSRSALIG